MSAPRRENGTIGRTRISTDFHTVPPPVDPSPSSGTEDMLNKRHREIRDSLAAGTQCLRVPPAMCERHPRMTLRQASHPKQLLITVGVIAPVCGGARQRAATTSGNESEFFRRQLACETARDNASIMIRSGHCLISTNPSLKRCMRKVNPFTEQADHAYHENWQSTINRQSHNRDHVCQTM